MDFRIHRKLSLILGLLFLILPPGAKGQTPDPVVHAVLFYHPTCPHCHQLINETLVPLQNQYGTRLVILGLDTSQQWANTLYYEAIRYYKVPEDEWAVPFLLVAEEVLVGGDRIPRRFPTIIEEGLAAGGIDLPNFPAFLRFLEERQILDPRFPDRLIARQAPTPEGEEPSVAGDSVVGDSATIPEPVAADEPLLAGDTAAVTDSVATDEIEAVGVPSEPLVRAVDSTGAVDTPGAVGPPGELPETLPEAPAAETGGGPERPLSTSEGMGVTADSSAREEAQGFPAPESAEPEQEALRPLGLAEAARELESMTMWDRFNMDRVGNSVSVLVLLVMVLSLIFRGYPPWAKGGEWPAWVIPALVAVGVGVAAYLSFIEMTHAEAVCGPLGDCNTVNQSEYAFLFGVIPVGVLGLVGYGVVLFLWVLGRSDSGGIRQKAALGLWGAILLGTLFSLYLTFLEPFVIGATCAWCLTSAVVMTLLLWASAPLAARVWPADKPSQTSD